LLQCCSPFVALLHEQQCNRRGFLTNKTQNDIVAR
jgi:hypothetical protein